MSGSPASSVCSARWTNFAVPMSPWSWPAWTAPCRRWLPVWCPVLWSRVPTSVGYGASFEGIAPLLTMLTACAPGVAVVNIDNGFGAAALAHRILWLRETSIASP